MVLTELLKFELTKEQVATVLMGLNFFHTPKFEETIANINWSAINGKLFSFASQCHKRLDTDIILHSQISYIYLGKICKYVSVFWPADYR